MPAYKMRRFNKLNAHIEEEEAKAIDEATKGAPSGGPPPQEMLEDGFVGGF